MASLFDTIRARAAKMYVNCPFKDNNKALLTLFQDQVLKEMRKINENSGKYESDKQIRNVYIEFLNRIQCLTNYTPFKEACKKSPFATDTFEVAQYIVLTNTKTSIISYFIDNNVNDINHAIEYYRKHSLYSIDQIKSAIDNKSIPIIS